VPDAGDGRPRVSAEGWGLAEGEVCITFGYVKPTLAGSGQAEAEGGAGQGRATVFFVNVFEEKRQRLRKSVHNGKPLSVGLSSFR